MTLLTLCNMEDSEKRKKKMCEISKYQLKAAFLEVKASSANKLPPFVTVAFSASSFSLELNRILFWLLICF